MQEVNHPVNSPYIDLPFFAALSLATLTARSSALSLYSKVRPHGVCVLPMRIRVYTMCVHASNRRDISGSSHCSCSVRTLKTKGLTFPSEKQFIRFTPRVKLAQRFVHRPCNHASSRWEALSYSLCTLDVPVGLEEIHSRGSIRSIEPRLQQQVSGKASGIKFTIRDLTVIKNDWQLNFDM